MGPFVHKFETENNKYVYDVSSHRVFRTSAVTYDIIEDFEVGNLAELIRNLPQYSKREIRQSHQEITLARRKQQVFSLDRPKAMAFADGESIALMEHPSQAQLILNVTERCNLRCKYCSYSGIYQGQRKHSDRNMPLQIAKKSVDKFIQNMTEEPSLSFYGGEPLLRIDLIKETIDYIESLTEKKITYNMTTNGTLLNKNTAEYLRDKDFTLMVSLDGPRDVHDRNRVDTKGRGSFDRIMENLEYYKSLDDEFYKKNVLFSIVSAPPHRLKDVNKFFSTEPLVCDNTISFSYMDYTAADFDYSITAEDAERAAEEREDLLDDFIKSVAGREKRGAFATAYYEDDFVRFYHRPKVPLGEHINLNGCCVPGSRRLFVTVDGKLYVCERMTTAYQIGDVDRWIDRHLVMKLINDYQEMSVDCLDCWACRLCSKCFAAFAVGDKFDREVRATECDAIRSRLHNMLVHYYRVLEQDETAWDYMKDMKLE